MPAPLTIAARRTMVEELVRQEPGISARTIAARLGVGKDTIRRDLDAIEKAQSQTTPQPDPAAPDDAPERATLVLVLDEPLRQALAVLRGRLGAADTPEQNVTAVRGAIRAVADSLLNNGKPLPQKGDDR